MVCRVSVVCPTIPDRFHHTAARQAADAQRDVQAQRAGGDDLDFFDRRTGVHAHDGAFAELLLDLGQRGCQRLGFFRCRYYAFFIVHDVLSASGVVQFR
jgi:hypothetical protein